MVKSRLKHLLCAVFALVTACALFEVGLRVYDSATGQLTRKQLYDRGLTVKSWTSHHTLRPSHAFSVRNPDTEARVRVAINSFGLRGPEPRVPKSPGTYRVLCLGDENTLAQYIAEGETFPAVLQETLQAGTRLNVEVLNAGVPDSCPLLAYLRYRHELRGLQPDLVILTFDMSDVADDYACRRHTVISKTGEPLSCQSPDLEVPKSQRATKLEEAFLLPDFLKSQARGWFARQTFRETGNEISIPASRYAWLKDSPPDWAVHVDQALAPIESLASLVAGSGGSFVLAVCPAPWQVSATASNGEGLRSKVGVPAGQVLQSRKPFETLAAFCKSRSIPYCDPSSRFGEERTPDRLYLENAPTLSRQGHALLAAELSRFLSENQAGPWTAPESPKPRPVQQAGLFESR